MEQAKKLRTPEEMEKLEAIRAKSWEESNVEEKLEKLRMAILELPNYQYTLAEIQMKLRGLEDHSHLDGKIVVPMNQRNGAMTGSDIALRRKNPLE